MNCKFKIGDRVKVKVKKTGNFKNQVGSICVGDVGTVKYIYKGCGCTFVIVFVRLDKFSYQKPIDSFFEKELEKVTDELEIKSKPKKKYAWKFREDTNTISVEDSIEDCVQEAREYYHDYKIREIEVGEYTTYVPEFDDSIGETIREMSSCYFDEDDMDQWLEDEEKNKKLAKELNKTLHKFLVENNEVPNFGSIENVIYITIEGKEGTWKE